jgi:hypothetical protein
MARRHRGRVFRATGWVQSSILSTELPDQIADLMRVIGPMRVIQSPQVAIAIAVDPAMMLSKGHVTRCLDKSASMLSMSDRPVRVPPDELVTTAAVDVSAPGIARSLSRVLLEVVNARR